MSDVDRSHLLGTLGKPGPQPCSAFGQNIADARQNSAHSFRPPVYFTDFYRLGPGLCRSVRPELQNKGVTGECGAATAQASVDAAVRGVLRELWECGEGHRWPGGGGWVVSWDGGPPSAVLNPKV